MRMALEWLKDLMRPIRRVDAQLGAIRYHREARFWEGASDFAPTGRQVELLIDASYRGPTEDQRSFFSELERRYAALLPRIASLLRAGARHATGSDSYDFILVAIEIPPPDALRSSAEWSLSYETMPPKLHLTVQLTGWTPQRVIPEE